MSSAQIFISVSEMVEDQQTAGANESRWYQALRDASDFLQKEIGWFIPVTETKYFTGKGTRQLYLPPLLSVTSIVNDDIALNSDEYYGQPDGRHWPDGPYTSLAIDPEAENLSAWCTVPKSVVINGTWGLYARLVDTGTAIDTTQLITDETLLVEHGGKVSPGMVLLAGSEQELVTGWGDPSANVTALDGAITATDSVLTVDNGATLFKGEIIRVEFEQMKVKEIRSNQVSVIRNWNGSGQSAHADNTQVDVYRTVTVERAVNGTTAAEHLTVDLSRYVAPDDVQFLTRQIATLMLNKAKGGYQGKSGNPDTGVVFYNDAFPRFEIERVAANYYIPSVR